MIYGKIFGEKHHDATFQSIGSSSELEDIENQSVKMVSNILKSSQIIKFVDRDDKSPVEVEELRSKGIVTSSRRHIECYLFDDEVIRKLCSVFGKPDLVEDALAAKRDALAESVARGNPPDDIKSASGAIFNSLKRMLGLTRCGNNKCAFLRDTIAPLITEDMNVYRQLEREIFGDK
jgi:hypothetical protein